jgi:hypothetical protein
MMVWATFLLSVVGGLQGAVVLDRIAVIVGRHVIKASDIDRDLRLTQFLNREQPDSSSGAKHKAADRLIDQTIIRDEIVSGGYRRPPDSEADTLLNQLRKDRFGSSDARLRTELARYGVTESQLREQLVWQLTVLQFIDQRFRPGVLVTDEEVRAYYDQHTAELKRDYPQAASFEALDPKIRSSLEGERINQNFVEWLDAARKRVGIQYRQGAFE